MAIRVDSKQEAWELIHKITNLSFSLDTQLSNRANYDIYVNDSEDSLETNYVIDLGDRLELNCIDGSSMIWIDNLEKNDTNKYPFSEKEIIRLELALAHDSNYNEDERRSLLIKLTEMLYESTKR